MAGYREFQTGEVLTAGNVNSFLMEQAVMTFADAAARDAALSSVLREGLVVYNLDEGRLEVYNGTDWVEPAPPPPAGFVFAGTRYYTSSGNFDKFDPLETGDIGLKAVRVRAVGGGGAGGGATVTGSGQLSTGIGGAGGGYAEAFILVDDLGATETVTRGAGGTGTNFGGNAGGTTSFGTFVVATGGGGGSRESATNPPISRVGPNGGTGTSGDLLLSGNSGHSQIGVGNVANRATSGSGGNSPLSGGAANRSSNGDGINATGVGGGGGGALNLASQGVVRTGGDGADGIVIVDVFI